MIIPTERGDYKTLQGMLVLPSQIFFSHSHGERYVPWVLLGQVSRSYLINRLLADSLSLWIPSFRAFHRPSNYWMRCIHIMKGNLLKVTDCKCESHLKKKKKTSRQQLDYSWTDSSVLPSWHIKLTIAVGIIDSEHKRVLWPWIPRILRHLETDQWMLLLLMVVAVLSLCLPYNFWIVCVCCLQWTEGLCLVSLFNTSCNFFFFFYCSIGPCWWGFSMKWKLFWSSLAPLIYLIIFIVIADWLREIFFTV